MTFVLHYEAPGRHSRDDGVAASERRRATPRHGETDIMNIFERDDTTPRARETWARSIDGLLKDIDRPQPLLRSMRPLYRREVAAASAPSLNEIRWVLADQTTTVRPEAVRRLREFLTDGARSPLFHDDAEQARRRAREIAAAFVVPAGAHATKPSPSVQERVAAAARN
jgi:hypothetical protein